MSLDKGCSAYPGIDSHELPTIFIHPNLPVGHFPFDPLIEPPPDISTQPNYNYVNSAVRINTWVVSALL